MWPLAIHCTSYSYGIIVNAKSVSVGQTAADQTTSSSIASVIHTGTREWTTCIVHMTSGRISRNASVDV